MYRPMCDIMIYTHMKIAIIALDNIYKHYHTMQL